MQAPSLFLRGRLNLRLELLKTGYYCNFMVVGGYLLTHCLKFDNPWCALALMPRFIWPKCFLSYTPLVYMSHARNYIYTGIDITDTEDGIRPWADLA